MKCNPCNERIPKKDEPASQNPCYKHGKSVYQKRNRSQSAHSRPASSQGHTRSALTSSAGIDLNVKCMSAALSQRAIKSPPQQSRNSPTQSSACQSYDRTSMSIPLRLHISVSLPSSSPVAPCSSPQMSDCDSNELVITQEPWETLTKTFLRSRKTKPRLRMSGACSGFERTISPTRKLYRKPTGCMQSGPNLVVSAKRSELQTRPCSRRSRSACTRSSQSSTSDYALRTPTNDTDCRGKFVSQMPRKADSSSESLLIYRCSQSRTEKNRKGPSKEHKEFTSDTDSSVIKVRKSDNAFVMTKDGKIKKCTVFVPVQGCDYETENWTYATRENCPELSFNPSSKSSNYASTDVSIWKNDPVKQTNHHIEETFKALVDYKDDILQKKSSQPQDLPGPQAPWIQNAENQTALTLVAEGNPLLPQFQQQPGELKFSDVLNTLNAIGAMEKGHFKADPVTTSAKLKACALPDKSISKETFTREKQKFKRTGNDNAEEDDIVRRDGSRSGKHGDQQDHRGCSSKATTVLRQQLPLKKKSQKNKSDGKHTLRSSLFNYRNFALPTGEY